MPKDDAIASTESPKTYEFERIQTVEVRIPMFEILVAATLFVGILIIIWRQK